MHTCTYMYTYVHVCTIVCIYTEQTTPTLGVVAASPSNQQLLDQLPVERERGITVKAQTATMFYNKIGTDKQTLMLNLIDTPVRLISPSLPHSLPPSLSIILTPVSFPYPSHSLYTLSYFILILLRVMLISVMRCHDL